MSPPSKRRSERALLPLLLLVGGCSFVKFEPGVYQAVNVRVLYSEQEDLTFMVWRLPQTVDPAATTWSFVDGGLLRDVDLERVPFPAAPRPCGDQWCFQAQVDGPVQVDTTAPLLHARHPRFGLSLSEPPTELEAQRTTLAMDPIAVARNSAVDPRLFDGVAQSGLVQRSMRFTVGATCDGTRAGLRAFSETAPLPAGWTEAPLCLKVTPDRRDAPGALLEAPLVPSAETRFVGPETFAPPFVPHVTYYGVLFDLAVADPARCAQVQRFVGDLVADAIARQGESVHIGTIEPLDATNCSSTPPMQYGVDRLIGPGFDLGLTRDDLGSLLWVYVSNRSRVTDALDEAVSLLLDGIESIDGGPRLLTIVLPGADVAFLADWTVRYRPIEERSLSEDVHNLLGELLPFRTMVHDVDVQVPFIRPGGAYLRLCQSTPPLDRLLVGEERFDPSETVRVTPTVGYAVDLGTQFDVPKVDYVPARAEVRYELCDRFCDGPVRAADGTDLDDWLASVRCAGLP